MENEPIQRAGFQKDGTYVQHICRQTRGADGESGWYPPVPGEKIVTQKGPFLVRAIVALFQHNDRRYFQAEGDLQENKER